MSQKCPKVFLLDCIVFITCPNVMTSVPNKPNYASPNFQISHHNHQNTHHNHPLPKCPKVSEKCLESVYSMCPSGSTCLSSSIWCLEDFEFFDIIILSSEPSERTIKSPIEISQNHTMIIAEL